MSQRRDFEKKENGSNWEMAEMDTKHTAQDTEMDKALREFRMSVHAWSDAAYHRPRTAAAVAHSPVWRAASGWALGCALVAGIATGGVFQYQRGEELKRAAAIARQAEEQKMEQQLAAHRNEDADTLLAHVDSDVTRQVPTAMEPLAGLVGGEE